MVTPTIIPTFGPSEVPSSLFPELQERYLLLTQPFGEESFTQTPFVSLDSETEDPPARTRMIEHEVDAHVRRLRAVVTRQEPPPPPPEGDGEEVQHWMFAAPGQCPGVEVPWQEAVDLQVPETPLTVHPDPPPEVGARGGGGGGGGDPPDEVGTPDPSQPSRRIG